MFLAEMNTLSPLCVPKQIRESLTWEGLHKSSGETSHFKKEENEVKKVRARQFLRLA